MKLKTNISYVVLIICIFLQSCAYGPHIVDVPLMSGKNDAMVSAGISFPTGRIPAISLSAAYAPTDHLAIQAQGEYLIKNDYLPYWNMYHAQLAVGYYNKFSNNTVLENYYGGEIGNVGTCNNSGDLVGNYAICFTQINYGKIGLKAYGEVGGGLKIGYQYGEFLDVNYYAYEKRKSGYKETLYYHGLVLEPTIFYRFGWEHFRIGLQLSGCYAPSFVKYKLSYNPINAAISFSYRF